jgi:hypothetical protein
MPPSAFVVSFEGQLLQRGFWIYAWQITNSGRTVYYVGRTGDSSSNNAASPFNRIGTHLDARPNAKANSLTKRLLEAGLNPAECSFRMAAIGPLHPEQEDFESHRVVRDRMATLEHAVAQALRSQGHTVLGNHSRGSQVEPELVAKLLEELTHALDLGDA